MVFAEDFLLGFKLGFNRFLMVFKWLVNGIFNGFLIVRILVLYVPWGCRYVLVRTFNCEIYIPTKSFFQHKVQHTEIKR